MLSSLLSFSVFTSLAECKVSIFFSFVSKINYVKKFVFSCRLVAVEIDVSYYMRAWNSWSLIERRNICVCCAMAIRETYKNKNWNRSANSSRRSGTSGTNATEHNQLSNKIILLNRIIARRTTTFTKTLGTENDMRNGFDGSLITTSEMEQ